MTQINLGASFLGFLPNLSERRKVVEQRAVNVLEKAHNYAQFYQSNEEKIDAVSDKKEHIVRLLFTDDYGQHPSPPAFRVTDRTISRKTGAVLDKAKTEYWINETEVSKTEYDFGQYLTSHFKSLSEVLEAAQNENMDIKGKILQKEERLVREREKLLERKKVEKDAQLQQLEKTSKSMKGNSQKMNEAQIKVTENNGIVEIPKESDQLAKYAIERIKEYTKNPEGIREYLEFMSKFPELSSRNLALLQERWRGANVIATYDQWQGKTPDPLKNMPKVLGISEKDVIGVTRTITDRKTGETITQQLNKLSVRAGEKAQITLLRPITERYFEKERAGRLQPHFEKYWSATEKQQVETGEIKAKKKVRFTTYKAYEISQTNLKLDRLPQLLPNRHVNFEIDSKMIEAMEHGLEYYAASDQMDVLIKKTTPGNNTLGNSKGAYFPGEHSIILNHLNTPSENVSTLIHELTHATLHQNGNVSFGSEEYAKQELEAELTAFVVSSRYGLDTSKKSIPYIAKWTDNAKVFTDKELGQAIGRVQTTARAMSKYIDNQLEPIQKQAMKQQRTAQPAPIQSQIPAPTLSAPKVGR